MNQHNSQYCQEIQIAAAVGLELNETQLQHSQTCSSCSQTVKVIKQLDQRMMETNFPEVSDEFTTRVMQNIEANSKVKSSLFSKNFWTQETIQFILAILGLLLTTTSLVRFIFSVWLITAVAN